MAIGATSPVTGPREHVVLVDHDLDELKALVAPLRGQFEFHLTISASDALDLLEHRAVAVLVAGQKLFSTSGLELLVEARKRSPRTVRVLLADAGERRSLDQAKLEGVHLLPKPCTSQQLREVLQVGAWSSHVATDQTGEVEHVVMETRGDVAQAESTGAPVTVLTTDANLYEAIRTAVHGRHETHLATRLEDATELAATGRCPVLVTDMALAQPALERIARHLGTHEPALVTVVVGSREQGNALMGLLGSGVIHRFLLKPVTPGLARLAIDSAARHHQGLLTAPRPSPAPKVSAASKARSLLRPSIRPVARPATPAPDPLRTVEVAKSTADESPASRTDALSANRTDALLASPTDALPAARGDASPAGREALPANRTSASPREEPGASVASAPETSREPSRTAGAAPRFAPSPVLAAERSAFAVGPFGDGEDRPADIASSSSGGAGRLGDAAGRLDDSAGDDATFELTAPLSVQAESHATSNTPSPPSPRRGVPAGLIAGSIAVVVLAAAVAAWFWFRPNGPIPIDTRAQGIERNLAAAQTALDAGHLLEPAGQSAVHYYEEVLKADAANARALAGLDRIAEGFIQQTENFLVEGRLDEAAVSLQGLRQVRPQHPRLRFLDMQLRKEQQDRLVLQARESAIAGDTRKAQELLAEAARVVPEESGELNAAQKAISARERAQVVSQEIDLARTALLQGRLVTPATDSAKSHFRAAQRADPSNVAAQQGLRDLGERVVSAAERSIERAQFDNARVLVREAQDLGVSAEQVAALQARMQTAQQLSDLGALVVQRSEQNRLLEPAQDSARYYLDQLRAGDPQHPSLPAAVRTLGGRLVASAQLALSQRQFDSAARLLGEARAIGYTGADLTAADSAVQTARGQSLTPAGVRPASGTSPGGTVAAGGAAVAGGAAAAGGGANSGGAANPGGAATSGGATAGGGAAAGGASTLNTVARTAPRRISAAIPEYPRRALEKGEQGWVDVSFFVTPEGVVADARVEAATPRNTFDRAALNAVRQWKFEARTPQTAFTQRMRTRVEFKLND